MKISKEAELRLHEIATWTMERFGYRQANKYQTELMDAFSRIADGLLNGRSGRTVWGEEVLDGLLFAKVNSHLILYFETSERITIVDILHQSMDIPIYILQ